MRWALKRSTSQAESRLWWVRPGPQKTQADPSLEIKYLSIADPWVLREGLSVHVGKWNFFLVVIKAERSHFLQLTFPGPKIFEKVLKKNLALYKGTLGGYSK